MKSKNYLEEYVTINGIQQYTLHYKSSIHSPVLLYLHGDPGGSEAFFAYELKKYWKGLFTVVHWDQRGTGKTFLKNPSSKIALTIDLLLDDLLELIHYLQEKYHQKKIALLGHSWGSVLGTLFVKKHPEDILYYIGVGQVIDMMENEKIGYKKLKMEIKKANNKKDMIKLQNIEPYPEHSLDNINKIMKVKALQQKYKLASGKDLSTYRLLFKSPIFHLRDLMAAIQSYNINKRLITFLASYSLYQYDKNYKIPIYYILGDQDFQTPYSIAEKYLKSVEAPDKKLFLISHAGHNPMLEQPRLFANALAEIKKLR